MAFNQTPTTNGFATLHHNSPQAPATPSTTVLNQVAALGEEYNFLEERVAKVEDENTVNGKRLSAIEARLTTILDGLSQLSNPTGDADNHIRTDDTLVSSASTTAVAQELIRRLGAGDVLSLVLQRQLQVSVQTDDSFRGVVLGLPPTPALTTTASSRPPTVESSSDSDVPLKRSRHPTAKAMESSTEPSDSGPPTKHRRIGTSRQGVRGRKHSTSGASPDGVSGKVSVMRPVLTPPAKNTLKGKPTASSTKKSKTPLPEQVSSSQSWSSDKVVESTESNKAEEMEADTTGFGADMIIPPDLRRSTRTPKPVEDKDFVHWKYVGMK